MSARNESSNRVRAHNGLWKSQNMNTRLPAARLNYQIARLDKVNRNLRKTKLLAPYDGTIAWRAVEPNEEVRVGQKIFRN